MTLTPDIIIETIRDCLSPDLLSNKWNAIVEQSGEANKVAGHCAIASEALYDLLGGGSAGYTPFVCSYYKDDNGEKIFGKAPKGVEQMTHWWVRGPKDDLRGQGKILDATVRQYKKPFPYDRGRATGFMSPTPPSKRARILIKRVEKKLGAENIARFREEQIAKFQDAGGRVKLTKSAQRRRAELLSKSRSF